MSQFESFFSKFFTHKAFAPRQKACVFDLDSTLFCVTPRTEKILKDFTESVVDPSPTLKAALPALKQVQFFPTDWGLRSAFIRHQIQMTPEDFERLRLFWVQHFFSNDYLKYDLLYQASNEFVRLCYEVGYKVLYLTGRDDLSMRPGSLEQLKFWGFPLDEEKDLIMRPKSFEKDEDFKVQVLSELKQNYESIFFFENEPVIINRVLASKLDVSVIYMHSTHSGREDVEDLSVVRITPESYTHILRSR